MIDLQGILSIKYDKVNCSVISLKHVEFEKALTHAAEEIFKN